MNVFLSVFNSDLFNHGKYFDYLWHIHSINETDHIILITQLYRVYLDLALVMGEVK
jgi:hypothetical protein